MFACIHSRSVSKAIAEDDAVSSSLVDLGFTFSPLVERTSAETVTFDVAGQDLLFGRMAEADHQQSMNIAAAIQHRARRLKLKVSVSLAANPDTAIHAARAFEGVTIINAGDELLHLGPLLIKQLDCSLVAVDPKQAAEIHETLALWGVRTFRALAELPSLKYPSPSAVRARRISAGGESAVVIASACSRSAIPCGTRRKMKLL